MKLVAAGIGMLVLGAALQPQKPVATLYPAQNVTALQAVADYVAAQPRGSSFTLCLVMADQRAVARYQRDSGVESVSITLGERCPR